MKAISKYFTELTTTELYEILKARAEIFVVEQNCIYQDLDDIDYRSLHIFYEDNDKVIAYLRAFEKDSDAKTIQIGRVLSYIKSLKVSLTFKLSFHYPLLYFPWFLLFHSYV